ncbi:sodium/proline symporter PutP [Parashewanella spongiae]|uniref:Sodium/proline symporter n=1 Tax=Parashewanella spongiae TaxID=342950 RepID=A0A3A6U143_9GAMM|nr:sodium/proline symporter PutP [Parashewanella spongiae]MCL1077000.1 sodium/proline symporter PutP [Parashewanella spongiae]RJY19105.1 sodium/proline symporter PutP [Parashewanella spongiae]
MSIDTPLLITFSGYLILMLLIGFWAYKATNSVDDYILGGRKMGPGVTALSVGASDMSGWLLLGLPGAVYVGGLSEVWIGIGLLIGAWLNWIFVAKRLRIYTQFTDNALTLPDFFEKRFNDHKGILKIISAVTILIFFTFYTSSGMVGGAILFEKVFGLDYAYALLVGSIIIVSYTFIGGYFAVSWTDFFQGCLMLAALLIVPVAIFSSPENLQNLSQLDPSMLSIINDETTLIGLFSLLAWGLGYFGQPHILARFMAIGDPNDLKVSRRIGMSWMLVSVFGALAVGLAGAVHFSATPLDNAETVFIHLTQAAFSPWIGGLLIAAILSAIMSTIDSQLLVCSSVITEDFYRRWIRPKASTQELLLIGRASVITIAIIAGVIALDPKSDVLTLVSYAWAGFGAAFGPVVLLALFWRNYSRNGAVATILVGAITVIVWKELSSGIFDLYELLPAFMFATIAGIIVSVISPASNAESSSFEMFKSKL